LARSICVVAGKEFIAFLDRMDAEAPVGQIIHLVLDNLNESDLQARPVYHRQRDSIEAHLTVVVTALAVSRRIERRTGWSIRNFFKAARHYRTVEIQVGDHVIAAADPVPDDLREAFDRVHHDGAH